MTHSQKFFGSWFLYRVFITIYILKQLCLLTQDWRHSNTAEAQY